MAIGENGRPKLLLGMDRLLLGEHDVVNPERGRAPNGEPNVVGGDG